MARSHDGLAKLKAAREAKTSATMAFKTYDEARARLADVQAEIEMQKDMLEELKTMGTK